MSAGKYTSIPTHVEAMQWTGDVDEVWDWVTAAYFYGPVPTTDNIHHDQTAEMQPAKLYVAANDTWLPLEEGEWIVRDSLGFYPCKDSVFRAKYRKAD